MPRYQFHGALAIGEGARSFVANGPMTIRTVGHLTWLETTSTTVTASGIDVDITAAPTGERRRAGGYIIIRTETGVKARLDP